MQDTDRYLAGRIFHFAAWLNIILAVPFLAIFVFPVMGGGMQQQTMLLALFGSLALVLVFALVCFRMGAALKQQSSLARVVGMVLAALMLFSFPFGTVLGGLLLYFLIRDRGAAVN